MSEKLHIVKQSYKITKEDRGVLKGHKPLVIWFTGLSGSGKSTLANSLEIRLHENKVHTYILDGDNIRFGLNRDLDFSDTGRIENIRRIGEVSKLLVDAGIVVLTAFISPFASDRENVKNIVGVDNFFEVFVQCPIEICEQRDVKGLYAKARKGEIKHFTGITSPFEEPQNPNMIIPTHLISIEDGVSLLFDAIKNKLTHE